MSVQALTQLITIFSMSTIKTMGAASIAAAMLLSAGVAFAEGIPTNMGPESVDLAARRANATTTRVETEKAARERVKAEVAAKKAEIEKTAREAKERVKAATESAADARKAIATTTRAAIKEIRKTAKEDIKEIREKEKDRMKVEREKATARMADIQDKKRQQMAQKLAAQFEALNKTWTDKFAAQLDRYNAMVQKMEARAATAAAQGKDVTVANATIQAAKSVITVAQAGVVVQAAKVYVPDTSAITTTAATTTPKGQEELTKGLRAAFQTLHTSLFKDLFALRDGPMASARKAVQDALVMLGKVPGVDEKKTATQTSTTTNQ